MYKQHNVFNDPAKPNEFLWRYMDWPRFFLLLKTKKLFFSSGDTLRVYDQYEGSLPNHELKRYLSIMPLESIQRGIQQRRKEIFVSCWHYSDTESIAMWKIYAPTGNGIAVQTTIPNFKKAFDCISKNVHAGKVIYINYDTEAFYQNEVVGYDFLNGFVAFIHKRQQFKYESEYRAIISNTEELEQLSSGIEIDIDLSLLVRRVVVAPKTPVWIIQAAQFMLDDYLPNVKVERSIDDRIPIV